MSEQATKPEGITLTHEEFVALDQMVGKLPTNLGIHFVDFFRLIQQRKQLQEQQGDKSESHEPLEP